MQLDQGLEILRSQFKLTGFRKGQFEIISAFLAKKDVLAVLPTGGGKSLCYQFASIASNRLVIVVSPLIALMKDQVRHLSDLGIPAGALYSGQTDAEKRELFQKMQKPGPFLLYLSPERVAKEGFKRWIANRQIGLFAVDEAHCVSQWGHDFREEYMQLSVLKELRPDVPTLALTASATPTVLRDISEQLRLRSPEKMVHGFYRSNLYYQVSNCEDEAEKINWLRSSLKQFPEGRVIVYCGTRKLTEEVFSKLSQNFEGVGYYHAGIETETRHKTQDDYANGKLRILVATNAFGMGIDQPDVRLVVHFNMPANIDALYQEMGRAGRDGLPATCLMLYSKKDKGLQSYFIQSSDAPHEIKAARWRNLDTLVAYAEGSECRHSEILTYYRDSQRLEKCGHCDVCSSLHTSRVHYSAKSDSLISLKRNKIDKSADLGRKSKLKTKRPIEVQLDTAAEKRFEVLRRWRKARATEMETPAFIIFSDLTLKEIAKKNPKSLDELIHVKGIGETKLNQYGWDILGELAAHQF